MVVRLRDRIAVSVVVFDAQFVGAPNRAVCNLTVVLKPGCERRAEVEVERLIVVADMDDVPLHHLGMRVGAIAFAQNALVPVREGRGARLDADQSGPRTLARRLIKMAMNYDVTGFIHRSDSSSRQRVSCDISPFRAASLSLHQFCRILSIHRGAGTQPRILLLKVWEGRKPFSKGFALTHSPPRPRRLPEPLRFASLRTVSGFRFFFGARAASPQRTHNHIAPERARRQNLRIPAKGRLCLTRRRRRNLP